MIYSNIRIFVYTLLALGSLTSCKLDVPEPDAGETDLTKVIAIGGNYMAGYQDGALYHDGQNLSVAALVAGQLALAGGGEFNQPLMPDDNNGLGVNFKSWESDFVTRSNLGDRVDCEGESSLGPVKSLFSQETASAYLVNSSTSVQNLAVPFATLQDIQDPVFGLSFNEGNTNPYYHRFASVPGVSTIAGDANAQNPTFFVLWTGMEEIYNYASVGGFNTDIPSPSVFESRLDSLLLQLTAGGAKGVLANIPDIDHFPFYNLIPYDGLELTKEKADSLTDMLASSTLSHIVWNVGKNGFMIYDSTALNDYRHMRYGEYVLLTVPLDSMKCNFYGLFMDPIHDRYSLMLWEISKIKEAINAYNGIIEAMAAKYDLALADINSFFTSVQSGVKWDGADYNMEFVSGGFLSLDGYHPNQKGYALIANEFIHAINLKYNSVIPTVNCESCSGIRFP